ncbi:LysR family transcriptional regulator [Acaryochloris sp. CCMEE 5410]|uniref:LysR family transcriptional regulator n=1 Tax=Acaryochloris sp. CCMEE 5410 TaxID=310037 RepID=UPI00024843D9|nr:LysR family transcriptional regulator [Acaryochloris sp. CCMEE 5410]KAI9129936.1 LysR family transcriptional regulator [Acaryochloris sp. CCMEE 5410]
MTIELRQLEYFVVVAEELNFRRAAERLHIAQPPLSRKIRQLEQEIGVELLHRTTRKTELTAAGQMYLPEAKRVLAQVKQASAVAKLAEQGKFGHLRIGFEGSSAYDIVPESVRAFKERCPDVTVFAHEMATGDQVQAIREGRVGVGFMVPLGFYGPDLKTKTILQEPLVAVLPRDHVSASQPVVNLSTLRDETFIICPRQYQCGLYDHTITVCHEAGFSPKLIQETHEVQSILGFVAAGLGVALLPASVQRLQRSHITYRPFNPPLEKLNLVIAWRSKNAPPMLPAFLDVVQKVVHQILGDKAMPETNISQLVEVATHY